MTGTITETKTGTKTRATLCSIRRKLLPAFAVVALGIAAASVGAVTGARAFGAWLDGPGRGITGNSTGGIIPYRPTDRHTYQLIAETFCARYGRLGKVTSIDPAYGDYVSFVCYDRRGMIH